jgi:FkbM family methyltransferase
MAHAFRSLLGVHGIAANLHDLRSAVQGLQGAVQDVSSRVDAMAQWHTPISEDPGPPASPAPLTGDTFVTVRLPTGASYQLSLTSGQGDHYHRAVADGSAYDPNWHFLNAWIRPGDVFLDLGANIGTISIPAAVNGATVHAFELLDANVRHLVKSVQKNSLNNVSFVVGAVYDRHDCVGVGGVSAWGTVLATSLVAIPTIVIDAYVERKSLGRVDMMKLDVEGSENRALEGAAALIARDHPDVVIECNALACGSYGYSFRTLLKFLERHGYRLLRLLDHKLCEVTSEAVQELVFTDYLATTKTAADVALRSGWPLSELGHEDIVESIVNNERYGDVHKIYILAIRHSLPRDVLADRRVASALESWRPLENQEEFAKVLLTGSA